MSDNIPFEIQIEIIKRLPVKSLIQFRTVSKTWKSLIDGADFMARYTGQQVHQLVSFDNSDYDSVWKYVSVVDDDTFPQQKVSMTIPRLVRLLYRPYIVGCSNGLLCLHSDRLEGGDGPFSGTSRVVLWNLAIRKAVAVDVRNVPNNRGAVIGFGVCRETIDPKIVKITQDEVWTDIEVFTLRTGAWRRPYSNLLPHQSISFMSDKPGVAVDGLFYWLAADADSSVYDLVISFDMTSEEFREVNLPDGIEMPFINKLRESLVVVEQDFDGIINVWMMVDSVSKSFTKLLTVDVCTPHASSKKVMGFRKTGEPIIHIIGYHDEASLGGTLVVYEPHTKRINNLGISETRGLDYVCSYMESLLLLDQPSYE